MLFVLLLAAGGAALFSLRREGFPKVPVKIVVVSTAYKGAAASEIEQTVTNPLESAISDLKEVKSFNSTSSDNHSLVSITLNESADVDTSLQDVTTKVNGVVLPKDADQPTVSVPTTGSSDFVLGLYDNQLTPEQLLAQGRILDREVGGIKGIKQVKLATAAADTVTVTLNPAALARAGVSPTSLTASLAAANLNVPAGANLVMDGSRSTVLVSGAFTSLADLAAAPIATAGGSPVRLDSLATISQGVDFDGQLSRLGYLENGQPTSHAALVYNVDLRSDADILSVSQHLDDRLNQLKSDGTLSSGVHVVRLFDDAANTRNQVNELVAGAIGENWPGIGPLGYVGYLVGGIWLLMLAMFLFVNLRTALIAGVAIPLSFLVTLIALYLRGYTLNTLTLFSMILVLGLVVDPAIVVLESIQRHKDMGRTGRDGLLEAISSIGPGLVLATLCSIIVFTPFGIVSGIFGEVIRYIPITVIPALVASFLVPLIFLAPLAGWFMKPRRGLVGPISEEAALWRTSRWFKRANLFILRHLWLQIIIIVLAVTLPLGVTGYLFASGRVVPAQFSKPHNTIEASATVSYPASSPDSRINQLATDTERVFSRHPEIQSYYYQDQTTTSFMLYLKLTPIAERSTTAEDLVAQLKRELPSNSSKQVYSTAAVVSPGTPVAAFPVQIQVYDSDLARLKTFDLALADHARHLAGVTRVSDGYTDAGTNLVTVTPTAAAAAHGLSTAALGAQLGGLFTAAPLTKLNLDGNQVDVVGRFGGDNAPATVEALRSVPITTPTGLAPLGQIATVSANGTAGTIQHQDGSRYATVRAQVDASHSAAQVQTELNQWAKDHLTRYHLQSDALTSKGENDDIAASFLNLFAALGLAILIIYLVLAVFFRSFLKPIIITFALPLSFLGVFPVLALERSQFGFLEILGLITLAGIVVNVGIFVIDYANRHVAAGMPVKEAIATATAVRFRPIFLTKVTALGSLLPLALLSPFWRGLASVIIAGILTSGVLSLFTTPILYSWFSSWSTWTSRRRKRQTA